MLAQAKSIRRAQREAEKVEHIAYLQEMERRTKEIEAGQCDWLNELMACNEEPDLVVGSEEMTLVLPDGTAYTHYFDTDCAEF